MSPSKLKAISCVCSAGRNILDPFTASVEGGIEQKVLPAVSLHSWFDANGDYVHSVVVEDAEGLQRRGLPILVQV